VSRSGILAHALRAFACCGALLLASVPLRAQVLRARLNSDIVSTDPGTRRDENTDGVILHIVEGLVGSREDGSVGPMLASRWTISPDGQVYTFTLRPEVVFHNGVPLTAAEVVWSLHRYLKPETHWRCLDVFGPKGIARVLAVTALDPHTVEVKLDRAAPMFLTTLARADCGVAGILHPDSVRADGSWIAPIGTGPFELGEWRHNQFVQLKRFPRYASLPGARDGNIGGKHALVDELRFLVIPDTSAARAALVRASLDIIDNLYPSELMGIRNRPDLQFQSVPVLDCYSLLIQTQDPLLRDVRIRTAVALTIDAPALTKVITRGTGTPNNSPIPAASPFHRPVESKLRTVDIGRARRLLEAAGYDGRPIHLITSRRDPQMFDIAVVVQAMAAQAGINLQIDTLDWPAHLARYTSGDYQMMVESFSPRLDPTLSFGLFIGDKRREPRKVWDTGQARDLLEEAMQTADTEVRQKVFDQLTLDFLDQVPAIVLFNSARLSAVRAAVSGHQNWMSGQPRLWGVGLR
jgi:peptide/nickel transport system substrate-binding protein